MVKIAYFDCYSGASGDMLLAALVDKSVDFNWFTNQLKSLPLPEKSYTLKKTYVNRSSISSCKIDIELNHHHHHHHQNYDSISKIIDNSGLEENARRLSKKIFHRLAIAEASVHNTTIEKVHFHEVGALDSIIDIAGFSLCYSSLNIDKCYISPLPAGTGEIKCAHGTLPVPAPATVELLKNSRLKIRNNPHIHGECLTPTATAILSTIIDECSDFPEVDNIINTGYGAGNKIFAPEVTSNLRFIEATREE